MIEELGIADPEDVGYYAGMVESLFAITLFFTGTCRILFILFIIILLTCVIHQVFAWGRLSDRVGRKPVLLLGLLGVSISTMAFGKQLFYILKIRCFGSAD
jgi:MFS family permease